MNGYDDIVKFLVDVGCNLECFNNEKDILFFDVVENGYFEVVNILFVVGVNFWKVNVYGEEFIVRINEDLEYVDEIRKVL